MPNQEDSYIDFSTLPRLWDQVPVIPESLLSLVEPDPGTQPDNYLISQIASLPGIWINPGDRQADIAAQRVFPVTRPGHNDPGRYHPDQALLIEDYRYQGEVIGHGISYWAFDPLSRSWALIRRYNRTGADEAFTSLTDPIPATSLDPTEPQGWEPILNKIRSGLEAAPLPAPELELAESTGIKFRTASWEQPPTGK